MIQINFGLNKTNEVVFISLFTCIPANCTIFVSVYAGAPSSLYHKSMATKVRINKHILYGFVASVSSFFYMVYGGAKRNKAPSPETA